jgi:hypothetical protein
MLGDRAQQAESAVDTLQRQLFHQDLTLHEKTLAGASPGPKRCAVFLVDGETGTH